MPTIFIGLILGTKEVKDRRTLTCLGNGYKGTEDSGAFGTHGEVPLPEFLSCTPAVHRGLEETRNKRL